MSRFFRAGLLLVLAVSLLIAQDKPTRLQDAKAAVEANLRTREGKAFDEQLGKEFVQNHLGAFHQCKAAAGNDLGNFWMLMRLNQDGSVREVLLYPATKLGVCARDTLLKDKFPAPPRPDYWVSVYMKLAH